MSHHKWEIITSAAQAEILEVAAAKCQMFSDIELRQVNIQTAVKEIIREHAETAFDDIVCELEERLVRPPFYVVVRGLPYRYANQLLVSLSASLGQLVEPYRQSWNHVVRQILPRNDKNVHGRILNEFLHTDSTDWKMPNGEHKKAGCITL